MENLSNLKELLKNYYYFQQELSLEASEFSDKLFEKHFKDRKFRKLALYKLALDTIISNLIRCGNVNKCLVKPNPICMHKHYAKPEWYTISLLYNIFQILIEQGYVQEVKGFKDMRTGIAKSGKYIPTNKLKSLTLNIEYKKPDTFIFMNKRDKNHRLNKKKIPVIPHNQDKPLFKRMDRDIRIINEVIGKAVVRFKYETKNHNIYDPDSFEYNLENYLNTNSIKKVGLNEYKINKNSMYLKRIFNRNDYMYGGRFYTPIYIGIPGEDRKSITIDREETVELDYSAHHIRMLYHRDNLDFDGKPYVYDKGENDNARSVHKYMAMIAINAESRKSSIGAVMKSLKDDKKKGKYNGEIPNWKQLQIIYDDFLTYHKEIAHHVSNDEGAKLQRIDSDIMNNILVDLSKDNIVGLPVHDSVIVKKKHESRLKELMIKHYVENKKLNGKYPVIS